MSVIRTENDKTQIYIKDLFGAALRRLKLKNQSKPGPCQGIELYTYSERDANKLKHKVIFLSHPSEETCNKWMQELQRILKSES